MDLCITAKKNRPENPLNYFPYKFEQVINITNAPQDLMQVHN